MSKQLHELINYIPKEIIHLLPPGVTYEKYWEVNDSFLNGYDEGSNIILTYRCKFTQKKLKVSINNFDWYGFVYKDEWLNNISIKDKNDIKANVPYRAVLSGKYIKLHVKNESIHTGYSDKEDDKMKLRRLLEHYNIEPLEFDLGNYKRFCIDNEIKIDENFKYLFFDIETDDRQDGIVIGRDRILSFAAVDQDGKKKFFILQNDDDNSEKELLTQIFEFMNKYDLIVGWNSKNFDIPYLKERYKMHFGHNPDMRNIAHIDFMVRFQKLFHYDIKIRSWSLNFIASYFISDQKVEIKRGTYDLFINDKAKLKEYNTKDCILLYDLEKKLKVLDLVIKECVWCGCFPSKFYISELLDNYILRYSNKKNVHFKSASFGYRSDEEESEKESIIGGFVMEPKTGLHDNIHVFDFKSLYPSLIMTWNISLDTFVRTEPFDLHNHIKTVNGFWFKKNTRGMLPVIIEYLLTERKRYKKIQFESEYGSKEYDAAYATQLIVKEMANSCFGTIAQRGNRYYDKHLAESITLGGHYFLQLTAKLIKEKFGHDTIYQDTDSFFIAISNNQEPNEILDYVHEQYPLILKKEFNIDKSYLVLEYEKKFKKFLMLQKKNYVGRLVEIDGKEIDEIYGRGLEYVKKDTIEYGRRLQIEIIRKFLYDNATKEQIIEFIESEFIKFRDGQFDISEITIRNKINRLPENYKSKNVVAEVVKKMIADNKEFYVGMFVPYIITDSSKTLTAIHADDYNGVYDKIYYWDKKIYALLKRIALSVFPEYDWDQYEFHTIERRKKKISQYKKWLSDPKKKKSEIIEKIKNDKLLSDKNKSDLLEKKSVFKIKPSSAALDVKSKIQKV
jgi:DNA polymerase, archaea type